MKEVEAIETGELMFDDCEETKAFNDSFQSVVYSSSREYLIDLLILSKNEDLRSTPEERQKIMIDKIHARRRYDEHIENGGTEIDDDLDDMDDCTDSFDFDLFTKKALH